MGLMRKGRIEKIAIVCCVLPVLLSLSRLTLAQDPQLLLTEIYERQGLGTSSFVLDLQVDFLDGQKTQTAHVRVYLHETKKQLVTFTQPERLTNQSYLVIDTNTWMYQQGLNRPLRISAQQKLFGEAGIAETVGIDYLHDYQVVKVEETATHYQMELVAVDKRTAYQKASLWVAKDRVVVEKIVLSALNGQPLKELLYHNYRSLNGHEIATMEIRNLLYEKAQRTVVNYLAIRGQALPENAFDPLMMGKFHLLVQE
ncbi:MAG TPA: hypothetical protein DD789_01005 [Firmicutes bacterium]|nr:hypothetical protein [Bacillota bacterium]